jgi:hypothetical protein
MKGGMVVVMERTGVVAVARLEHETDLGPQRFEGTSLRVGSWRDLAPACVSVDGCGRIEHDLEQPRGHLRDADLTRGTP